MIKGEQNMTAGDMRDLATPQSKQEECRDHFGSFILEVD